MHSKPNLRYIRQQEQAGNILKTVAGQALRGEYVLISEQGRIAAYQKETGSFASTFKSIAEAERFL